MNTMSTPQRINLIRVASYGVEIVRDRAVVIESIKTFHLQILRCQLYCHPVFARGDSSCNEINDSILRLIHDCFANEAH